jgi:hypothetical protein
MRVDLNRTGFRGQHKNLAGWKLAGRKLAAGNLQATANLSRGGPRRTVLNGKRPHSRPPFPEQKVALTAVFHGAKSCFGSFTEQKAALAAVFHGAKGCFGGRLSGSKHDADGDA